MENQPTKQKSGRQEDVPAAWSILEAIPEPLVVVTLPGQVAYANAEAAQLFGYPQASLIGQPLGLLLRSASGEPFNDDLEYELARARKDAGFPRSWSSRRALGVHPNGQQFPVEVRPRETAPFGERRVLLALRDLSRAESLADERNRLIAHEETIARIAQSLVDQTDLATVVELLVAEGRRMLDFEVVVIWLADPARRTLTLVAQRDLSPAEAARLSQLTFDSPFVAAAAAKDREVKAVSDVAVARLPEDIRRSLEQGGLASVIAVPIFQKQRLLGVVSYGSRSPRQFNVGELAFHRALADLFAVAIENARLYGELNQAMKLREEFIGAAGHELKTPVTVIKGRTQLLLKEATDEPVVRALQTIERQTDRITSLIDDLLAIARLRTGLEKLKPEVFDLGKLLEQQVEDVARTTEHHQFQPRVDEPLWVDAASTLIGEVIRHLLENAIRYSPGGGLIVARAERRGNQAIVQIVDHGVGIPPERQRYVFEPFYESVPAGAPGYIGLVSLGLYLSKQIINAQGGQIWLISAPGKGSTFAFSLPLTRAPETGAAAAAH